MYAGNPADIFLSELSPIRWKYRIISPRQFESILYLIGRFKRKPAREFGSHTFDILIHFIATVIQVDWAHFDWNERAVLRLRLLTSASAAYFWISLQIIADKTECIATYFSGFYLYGIYPWSESDSVGTSHCQLSNHLLYLSSFYLFIFFLIFLLFFYSYFLLLLLLFFLLAASDELHVTYRFKENPRGLLGPIDPMALEWNKTITARTNA